MGLSHERQVQDQKFSTFLGQPGLLASLRSLTLWLWKAFPHFPTPLEYLLPVKLRIMNECSKSFEFSSFSQHDFIDVYWRPRRKVFPYSLYPVSSHEFSFSLWARHWTHKCLHIAYTVGLSTAMDGHGHTWVTAEGFPRLPTHVDILVLGRIWDSEIGFSQFPTLT